MKYLELVFDKNDEVNLFDTNLCQFNVDRFKLAEKRLFFELAESRFYLNQNGDFFGIATIA